jgi:hypothetical protein
VVTLKAEDLKSLNTALNELNESYSDLLRSITETTREVKTTKKLWRKGGNSLLVKVGLALIAFPDPTISDIVGATLVAAGTVQAGIRRRTLYVEDIYKTFNNTFKDVLNVKDNL